MLCQCAVSCVISRAIHLSWLQNAESISKLNFTRVKSSHIFADRGRFFGSDARMTTMSSQICQNLDCRPELPCIRVRSSTLRSSKCHFSPSPHLLYSLDEQTREVTTMPSGLPFDATLYRANQVKPELYVRAVIMRSIPLIRWRC